MATFGASSMQSIPELSARWLPVSWTAGLLTVHLITTSFVNHFVPEAYMDEPFHVPMTQRYCQGEFLYWDPKVTTFPGLYFIGLAYAKLACLLMSFMPAPKDLFCSVTFLRSVNALLSVACFQVLHAAYHLLHTPPAEPASSTHYTAGAQQASKVSRTHNYHQQQQGVQRELFWAPFALACLPTHLFFAFLYYTDVPALLFLLVTQLLLLMRRPGWAAVAGAAAVAMRQTNAVWVTFMTAAAMLEDVYPHNSQQQRQESEAEGKNSTASIASSQEEQHQQQQQQQQQAESTGQLRHRGPKGDTTSSGGSSGRNTTESSCRQQIESQNSRQLQQDVREGPLWQELLLVLQQLWLHRWQLLKRYSLLLLLPAMFAAFVVWNKGITLGDREAHAPVLHLMQPLYFGLFTLLAAPLLLAMPDALQQLVGRAAAAPVATAAVAAAAAVVCARLVGRFTLEHPYLLADNRHYTFYLWRKVMGRAWWVRYGCIPGYVLGWALLVQGLGKARGRLWVLGFVASSVVTLVPAWLLEFRYFTPPLMLSLLHLKPPPVKAAQLTAAAYVAMMAVLIYVFACKPYTWGDGSTARFMW